MLRRAAAAALPLARTTSSIGAWGAARRAALATATCKSMSTDAAAAASAASNDDARPPSPSSSSSSSTSSSSSSSSSAGHNHHHHRYALDDDQIAFEQLAADFARERLAPNAADWDERSHFPVAELREAAALGFAGMAVPERYGGAGLSRLSASVVYEALARSGDVPFSAYLSIHNMVAGAVATHADADARRFAARAAAAAAAVAAAGGAGGGDQKQQQQHLQKQHAARRRDLLARLCSMDSLAAYCLTEPGSGSAAAELATTAVRATCPSTGAAGWSLRGSKSFISGAGAADVYLVMARVVDGDGGGDGGHGNNKNGSNADPSRGITAFLVDRGLSSSSSPPSSSPPSPSPLSFGAPEKKMGWRMQPTASVHLDGVFVPDGNVVGPLGGGFRAVALRALDGGRVNIGACSVGGAHAAIVAAARYAHERHQFGGKIWDFQMTRARLADALTDVEASRLLVRRAAAALDRVDAARRQRATGGGDGDDGDGDGDGDGDAATALGDEASALAAMAKRFASDRCFDAANAALQTFGGYGYLRDYGVERAVRDLRVHSLLEGTNEVMRLVVAKKHPVFVEAAAAAAGGGGGGGG